MPHFKKIQDDLMFYTSEDDATVRAQVKGAINRTLFNVRRAVGAHISKREVSLTTAAQTSPDTAVFSGSGLDDLTAGGTYTGDDRTVFTITVDAAAATDTFKWVQDAGTATTGVAMTGAAQTLAEGVTVTFAATTGHTVGNAWKVVVSMRAMYGLPLEVQGIDSMIDTTNDETIREITSTEYNLRYPNNADAGTPYRYYIHKQQGVQRQINTAGFVTIVGDSTVDDGNRYVRITGYDANGTRVSEKLTMDGTTDVTGTQSFDPAQGGVERIVKSADSGYTWNGNVIVEDSDGNVISRIPVWTDSPTYLWVEFYYLPADPITYTIYGNMHRPQLINDDDWPEIDEDFHDLLLYGPGAEILPQFKKTELAAQFGAKFEQRFKEYKKQYSPSKTAYGQFADVTKQPGGTGLMRPRIPATGIPA